MAALLTSETGNIAKVVKYINECREMDIRVLPPDVNASEWSFTPVRDEQGDAIRFGLGAVKNVGQNAVEAIIKARAELGRFRSLYQFCEHVDMTAINRRMIESLIKAGAMDSLEGTRAQLLLALDAAIETGKRAAKDRDSGQAGLFGGGPAEEHPEPALPKANDWTLKEKLQGEKELLGFYVTGHPLDSYEEKIAELATHDSSQLEGLEKGTEVALCGMITGVQKRRNREGKPWASLVIEDRAGSIEAMVFTTQYERLCPMLVEDQAVLIRGSALARRRQSDESIRAGDRAARCGARAAADSDQREGIRGTQRDRPRGGASASSSNASRATRRCGCAWKPRAISP